MLYAYQLTSIIIKTKALLISGTSGNVAEGLSSSMAQLRINGVDREGPLQSIKMLDENLHWTDAALDVCVTVLFQ